MDDVTRRRLTGAAVLLLGAFALASLLPDPGTPPGPSTPRVVSFDLRTGTPAPRSAPAEPAAPEPPAIAEAPAADAAPGGWYVQVGSFEAAQNAKGALQHLYSAGLPALIQSVRVGDAIWYRVRVGPYGDEAAARRALEQLLAAGYRGATLVTPEPATE